MDIRNTAICAQHVAQAGTSPRVRPALGNSLIGVKRAPARVGPPPTTAVVRRRSAPGGPSSPGGRPAERPTASPQQARPTKHSARFNHPLRQRVARLVRAPLALANKLAHHSGAIKYCSGYYHLTRAAAPASPL